MGEGGGGRGGARDGDGYKINYIFRMLLIRGEPERAPNTRGTGSGFICIYVCIYTCMYVCGVIISVRKALN